MNATTRIARLSLLTLILLLSACLPRDITPPGETEPITLTILYTNDEHGWMAPTETTGGAAAMMQRWREDEGYTEGGPFLILSGGDTFTGPALSTWFDGASMIEVMNAMSYDAAAVGNHEFDFGIAGLQARSDEAEFPFLAANVVPDQDDHPIRQAILPYVVQEVSGFPDGTTVSVGIIGLATTLTPQTTMPTHVADLSFEPYAATLGKIVPQVREDGAEVIIVISHLCGPEQQALAPVAADLDIAMVGGGHCHQRIGRIEQGVALVQAGWQLGAYGRVDLSLDPVTKDVLDVAVNVKPNRPGESDADVQAVIDSWQAQLDDALLVSIGYTRDGIDRNSSAMFNMVTDAWREAYPADIAMSNPGGFRQDIEPGDITLADVVGVLPFDNVLVDVALTGDQVIASYEHGAKRVAVSGLTKEAGAYWVNGEPLDPDSIYHVLVNDFMYAGGDGYRFEEYDPEAYQTGTDWRQPVIEWISTRNTTEADPLDTYLDTAQR